MNTKSRTRTLVVMGLLTALEIIFAFVPFVGFINIPPVSATTLHIPVIIGAVLEGPLVGGILGLIFGLLSFITALLFPATPLALIFQNPLISVLPRILVGIGAAYVFKAFQKLDKLEKAKKSYRAVGASVYVLFSLALAWAAFYYIDLFSGRAPGMALWLRVILSSIPAAAILVIAGIFIRRFISGDKRNIGAAVAGIAGALINAAGVLGLMSMFEYHTMLVQIPNIVTKGLGVVLSTIVLTNSIPEAILACAVTIFVYKALRAVYDRRQAKPAEEPKGIKS